MNIRISIIIPVYNVENYIEECIQSVMNQTLTEAVECILVDDCGSDNSIFIAKRIIKEYSGNISFSIIHHKKNKGLSGARNTGIKAAHGEYLYFLDSDDSIIPECLELLWKCVERYPHAELVQAGGFCKSLHFVWLDLESKKIPEYTEDKLWICESFLNEKTLPMTAWNKLIKTSFVLDHSLFFEEGMINEDVLWTNHLACMISSMAILKKNTYYYRQRVDSIMSDSFEVRKNWLAIAKKQIQFYNTIDDCYRRVLFASIANSAINKIFYDYQNYLDLRKETYAILIQLASNASFIRRIGISLFCYSPYFLQRRIHYIKFIKKVLDIK